MTPTVTPLAGAHELSVSQNEQTGDWWAECVTCDWAERGQGATDDARYDDANVHADRHEAAAAPRLSLPRGYGMRLAASQFEVHATRLADVTRRWWDGDDNAVNDLIWTGLGVHNTVARLDLLTRVGGMVEREREVARCSDDDWERLTDLVGVDYGSRDFATARQIALDECIADTGRECWAVVREVAQGREAGE